jgi:hypothetical protein
MQNTWKNKYTICINMVSGNVHIFNPLPSFTVPKKNKSIHFLGDYWGKNKRLFRKSFPIPTISMVLQELEGFSFATALDLNMGYCTIRWDSDASRICTIIFPWEK